MSSKAYCVLFNPLAATGKGEERSHLLEEKLSGCTFRYQSLLDIPDKKAFLRDLDPEVTPILTGGDGTICRFINDIGGTAPEREVYYFPAGTANDFLLDINKPRDTAPFLLNPYVTDLPKIHFNGQTRVFLNGVGYGIDGYVCEEGSRLREKTGKKINYTGVALKGLAYAYKRCHAKVWIDGFEKEYDHVWMTPTMNGRYFGGAMMCAPGQDRMNPEHTVSLMVMRAKSRIRTLLLFPKIFSGRHVEATKIVDIYQGHSVYVRFDHPTALQIDGEVYPGVEEYRVTTCVAEAREKAAAEGAAVEA